MRQHITSLNPGSTAALRRSVGLFRECGLRPSAELPLAVCFLLAIGTTCRSAKFEYPFQNPDLPLAERVNNMVSLMTVEEKVAFLSSSPSVPRLEVAPV
jgi:hypothetical protein